MVAIGQVRSSRSPRENLEKAQIAARDAARSRAAVLVFPEYFMSWGQGGHGRSEMAAVAQPVEGPFTAALSELARASGLWIVAGMIERGEAEDERPFNTTVIVDDRGKLRGAYRKSHLFDAFGHRESEAFNRGDSAFTPIETPLGCTGLFVCYELRFPEIARRQALGGATILVVPSAWVAGPLKDLHWLTLLRARAIENGCYVVAAAQTGNEFAGQSVIVDPRGTIVAQAAVEECVLTGAIDPHHVEQVRAVTPSISHRRAELYRAGS